MLTETGLWLQLSLSAFMSALFLRLSLIHILLDEMVELAAAKGLFDGSVPQYRINFETRMMGCLLYTSFQKRHPQKTGYRR